MQTSLNFDAPRDTGRVMGELCQAKAVRVAGFYPEGARQFIVGWLRRHGPTSGEDLVTAATEHGYRAHDGRAFGPVFKMLVKRGLIVCLRSDLPRKRGHGTSGGRLYGAAS